MRRRVTKLSVMALKTLSLSVFLAGIIYLSLIHPNDGRVATPTLEFLKRPTEFQQKIGSVLLSQYDAKLSLSPSQLAVVQSRLVQQIGEHGIFSSKRFTLPNQVYVAIGNYPWRLEGRDSLIVPAGSAMTVSPGLTGQVKLNLAAIAVLGRAELAVAVDDKLLKSITLPAAVWPQDKHGILAKIGAYLNVDRGPAASKWQDLTANLTLTPTARVSLSCRSKAGVCLVGDPTFYKNLAEAPQSYVVVLVDTLRGDALDGGNAPTMSRLAAAGVQFKRAIAPGNLTSPSTNALLSCRKASAVGKVAFSYSTTPSERESFYQENKQSFPTVFKQALYETTMIGHVSLISEVLGVGVDHGFSQQIAIETEAYDTAQIEREVVEWLQVHADRPFLLYVHLNAPHAPYRAPWRDLWSTFPGVRKLTSYTQILHWLYQSEVSYTDRYLDKMLAALELLGLADRTTIILTGDHGDQHTNHTFYDNEAAPSFTGAYFDHGATLLNDEINVPLIVKLPTAANRPTGVKIYDFVSTLGIGSLLLDQANLSSSICEATSLSAFFDLTKAVPKREEKIVGSESFSGRAIIFGGRYKYIRSYAPTQKRIYAADGWLGRMSLFFSGEALYDLQIDPSETTNLAFSEPSLLSQARQRYLDYYQVQAGYELVLDGPEKAPFRVILGRGAKLVDSNQRLSIIHTMGGIEITGQLDKQLTIRLENLGNTLPSVEIANQLIELRATTLRLPYKKDLELPLESGHNASFLPLGTATAAYLRRVEDVNYKEHVISTGNSKFEKILREWGYLHED